MKARNLFTLLILSLIFIIPRLSGAQEKSGHVYEMTFASIPYEQIEDFNKFYETYGKPLDEQNEYILSARVYTHTFGPSWSVLMVAEYKDLESFAKARKRSDELFEKLVTDKSKIAEISTKFAGFLKGHMDALVTEVPNLTTVKK